MNFPAKTLICVGLGLVALGLFWGLAGKYIPLGRLPGDISIDRENFKFYFPLTTSLLLSVLGSVIIYIIQRLCQK